MEKKIIELLRENARLSSTELAERCGCGEAEVEKAIKSLEKQGIICGYTAILDESAIGGEERVKALIEVKFDIFFFKAYGLYASKEQNSLFHPFFQPVSDLLHIAGLSSAAFKACKKGPIGAVPLACKGERAEEGDVDSFGFFKISGFFQKIQKGQGSIHGP